MSKAIEMKKGVVEEITQKLEKSVACVVVDYKGLTVEQVTQLRDEFRKGGMDYKVYKNTLVRRAAAEVGNMENFNDELLVGTNGFIFSYDDAVAPAKVVAKYAKEMPNLKMKMGYVEGEYYDEAKLVELSKVPSREELIAKLLGSLKAPMSNFVYMLDALAKKKEEQEA